MWVLTAIDELESDDLQSVLVSVSKLYVDIAGGIMVIVAERDSSNVLYRLAALVNTYCRMSSMSGPLTADDIAAVDTTTAEVHGHYVLTHAKDKLFIEGLCMWLLTAIDELESDDLQSVLVSVDKTSQ